MKLLFIIAMGLLVGAGLMWAATFESGFVLLQYGDWSLETSLIVFMVAFVLLLIAGYFTLRSLVALKQTPKKLADWNLARRHRRAGQALTKGLITLEEGRWTEAERLLIRHASNSETPLLHYLAAARAAQKQNSSERRDNYLRLAHETTSGADVAVGVVQAELQLAANQKEQALATLQQLREMSPKHPYVLQLLQQLYSDMQQWQDVHDVLPDLRKRRVLASSDVKALSTDASVGQLQDAYTRRDWDEMQSIWQQSSVKVRQSEPLLSIYVSGLIQQNESASASSLMEDFLRKQWSDELVYLYGKAAQGGSLSQLAKAEKWLAKHGNNPWLLLTLGRLAKLNRLWAKSEEYLRASIKHGPRGETYQVLAEVLAAEGKESQVAEAYQKGLSLMLAQNEVIT
ncbi:MAG: tetratricopeptide repeat protein [Piscirickettsiaceae bacterium]|nr:tetratricopeptide repeat protein [Piscirickettsiaceae bacterium]